MQYKLLKCAIQNSKSPLSKQAVMPTYFTRQIGKSAPQYQPSAWFLQVL